MSTRERYVKPVVMQLHYSTEPEVMIASVCKAPGSVTGAVQTGCVLSDAVTPCAAIGS